MYCVNKNDKQVISVQGLEADEALNLFKEKVCVRTQPLIAPVVLLADHGTGHILLIVFLFV
jgi:hypothetical protein